jgi:hypothetical protein
MAQFNTITTGHIMLFPYEHVPKTSVIERIVSGDFWFLYWEGHAGFAIDKKFSRYRL